MCLKINPIYKEIIIFLISAFILLWSINNLIKSLQTTNQSYSQQKTDKKGPTPMNAEVAIGIVSEYIHDKNQTAQKSISYTTLFFFLSVWTSGILFSKFTNILANRLHDWINKKEIKNE